MAKTTKTRNYNEYEVVMKLQKKHDIRIKERTIIILYGNSSKGDIGIGSKGKIDFLMRYCGYTRFFTTKFD